jgi:hypothetical protein
MDIRCWSLEFNLRAEKRATARCGTRSLLTFRWMFSSRRRSFGPMAVFSWPKMHRLLERLTSGSITRQVRGRRQGQLQIKLSVRFKINLSRFKQIRSMRSVPSLGSTLASVAVSGSRPMLDQGQYQILVSLSLDVSARPILRLKLNPKKCFAPILLPPWPYLKCQDNRP